MAFKRAEVKHKLTLEDMHAVIDAGGSVLHDGQVITRKENLPTEADLAGDDAEAKAAALKNLDDQIALLQSQKLKVSEPPQPLKIADAGPLTPANPKVAPVAAPTLASPPK